MKNELKKARKRNSFTQEEAAKFLGVSLRLYKSYETEKEKQKTLNTNILYQLRQKKVDLLNMKQINNNKELLNEILKDGIKDDKYYIKKHNITI